MVILSSPMFGTLVTGILMFSLGFVLGRRTAERRARLYQRIRGI